MALAKNLAAIDLLSDGRLVVGVGPGSSARDYAAVGVPFEDRWIFLERHRAKTLEGLLARLSAKIAAYTCGQYLNFQLGRPLRRLADLLV